MKEKVNNKAKRKNKDDQTDMGESSDIREQPRSERQNDSKDKEVSANRKIVDRVRRGYPDGPGGSYDGF